MTDGTDRDLFVLSTAINTFFIPPLLKKYGDGRDSTPRPSLGQFLFAVELLIEFISRRQP